MESQAQTAAHGPFRETELSRHIHGPFALVVRPHHHLLLFLREPGERLSYVIAGEAGEDRLPGVARVSQRIYGGSVIDRSFGSAGALTKHINGLVADDGEDPAAFGPSLGVEHAGPLPDADERILDGLLRECGIAQNLDRDGVGGAGVLGDDGIEGIGVAVTELEEWADGGSAQKNFRPAVIDCLCNLRTWSERARGNAGHDNTKLEVLSMIAARTSNPAARVLLLAGAALITALVAALSFAPRGASAADSGRVRVMHASPDTPAVDIFVDGAKAVTALAFPNNTPYVTLPAGAHNVKVFVSPSNGSGAPALEANLEVGAGKDYTVLAVGELGKATLGLYVLEDDNSTPAGNNAHIRLIHASPDAPPVNVAVAGTNTNVFTGVAYRNFGPYTPVPAGTYSLDVKVNASGATVLTIPGLKLEAKTVYTAVAVGLAGNGTLKVIPLVDAPAPKAPAAPSTGNTLAPGSSSMLPAMIVVGAALVAGSAGLAYAARRAR